MAGNKNFARVGEQAFQKMDKINAEVFTLTYGSMVQQLLKVCFPAPRPPCAAARPARPLPGVRSEVAGLGARRQHPRAPAAAVPGSQAHAARAFPRHPPPPPAARLHAGPRGHGRSQRQARVDGVWHRSEADRRAVGKEQRGAGPPPLHRARQRLRGRAHALHGSDGVRDRRPRGNACACLCVPAPGV